MGYTFLDVLSDIGGIQSIIASTIVIILTILNHNNLDNHLIARFYKRKAEPKASQNKVNSSNQKEEAAENFVPTRIGNMKKEL